MLVRAKLKTFYGCLREYVLKQCWHVFTIRLDFEIGFKTMIQNWCHTSRIQKVLYLLRFYLSTFLQARNYQELVLVRKKRVDLPYTVTGLSPYCQCFPSEYSMVHYWYFDWGKLITSFDLYIFIKMCDGSSFRTWRMDYTIRTASSLW